MTWPRSHNGKVATTQPQNWFHMQSSARSLYQQWGALLGKESASLHSQGQQSHPLLWYQRIYTTLCFMLCGAFYLGVQRWCPNPPDLKQNLTWAIRAAISRASSLLTGNLPATISPLVWKASNSRSRSVSPLTWLRKYSLEGRVWEARSAGIPSRWGRLCIYLFWFPRKETTLYTICELMFNCLQKNLTKQDRAIRSYSNSSTWLILNMLDFLDLVKGIGYQESQLIREVDE